MKSMLLSHKLEQARMVIEEAFDTHVPESTVVAWSGGKDSTLLLSLVMTTCRSARLPLPRVLDIDQGDPFPEIIAFRDRIAAEWDLDLVVVGNSDALAHVSRVSDEVDISRLDARNRQTLAELGTASPMLRWEPSAPAWNHLMKTIPVADYIASHGIQAMFTGIRWDEHSARRSERYFSPRENPPHTRVHPLLHFTERDVWDATFQLRIPFNELYAQGYRSIDTRSGTKRSSDLPAWEQDLEAGNERSGRGAEKEEMMAQLRALGYM